MRSLRDYTFAMFHPQMDSQCHFSLHISDALAYAAVLRIWTEKEKGAESMLC